MFEVFTPDPTEVRLGRRRLYKSVPEISYDEEVKEIERTMNAYSACDHCGFVYIHTRFSCECEAKLKLGKYRGMK